MTPISAEAARDFTRQLAGMYARYPESLEWKRGVAEMAESMDTYLTALIDDPEQDAQVRDAA